jgi:hypothetical protein
MKRVRIALATTMVALAVPMWTATSSARPGGSDHGYWMLSRTGRVQAVDAPDLGQLPRAINATAMAPTSTGRGLWITSSTGGVFTLGDARFLGSASGLRRNERIVAILTGSGDGGYSLVSNQGRVFNFGTGPAAGGLASSRAMVECLDLAMAPPLVTPRCLAK